MKLAKILVILLLALFVGLAVVGGCVYQGYNRAISLDENVKQSLSDIDVQLKRRFDLIPNLVETVKGVAAHEEEIFIKIAEARTAYTQAQTVPEKAGAANEMSTVFAYLPRLQEAYPELRSNEAFLKLQDSVEGTENRLGYARKTYNERVGELNTFTRKMLGRMYASLADVEPAEYFEVEEEAKVVPKVDFSGKGEE
jgi:LemA protein